MRLFAILAATALVAIGAARAEAGAAASHQHLFELQSVLLYGSSALGQDKPVEKLERIGADRYRVSSNQCSVTLVVTEKPSASHPVFSFIWKKSGGGRLIDVVAGPVACAGGQ